MTRTTPRPAHRSFTLAAALAAGALAMLAPSARADEFVDNVNKMVKQVGPDRRSENVLLPLLTDLARPPVVLKDQFTAALYFNKGPSWDECKAWAQSEPQKKIIAALATVSKEENDPQRGFAFTLPYGVNATDPQFVTKDMYVDLGDPPTLAAARFLYLDELETVGILAHVEASRRLEAGDAAGALTVMKDWTFFCRQMCDRPFLKEKQFGMESMLLGIQRLSDIAYCDFRNQTHSFQPSVLASMVGLLRDRSLYLDRIRLPDAEFEARRQLISRVIVEKGGPNPQTFGPTMARVSATDRPLKLFSAAAYWDQVRAGHAGWYDSLQTLDGLRTDWSKRWDLSPFDVIQQRQSNYRLKVQNRPRFAVIGVNLGGVEELFTIRRKLEVEQSGTRMGLACYAYSLREKTLPTSLAATRPAFTRTVDADPYSSSGRELRFFLPVTQTPKDAHGNEQPFSLRLWMPDPLPRFTVPLDKSHFVIFSVGLDDHSEMAADCTQGRPGTGDYLLWPPALSLLRQYLLDNGQLTTTPTPPAAGTAPAPAAPPASDSKPQARNP